jgi:uncharacterized protein
VPDVPDVPDVPECLACGACCFSQLEAYVRVTGDDYARLGARAEELVWFQGNRAYLRMVDGHCAALEIDGGSARFVCSAYEARPQICRDLARGSAECRAERDLKSERTLPLLTRARPAAPRP